MRHHRCGEIFLGNGQGNEHARKEELGQKGERFCVERARAGRVGGVEVQEDVIWREVVAVVYAGYMVEVSVNQKVVSVAVKREYGCWEFECVETTYIEYMSKLRPMNVARLTTASSIR